MCPAKVKFYGAAHEFVFHESGTCHVSQHKTIGSVTRELQIGMLRSFVFGLDLSMDSACFVWFHVTSRALPRQDFASVGCALELHGVECS